MEISKSINKTDSLKQKDNVAFSGVKGAYNTYGDTVYRFYAPSYDSNRFKIGIELVPLRQDDDGKWVVKKNPSPVLLGADSRPDQGFAMGDESKTINEIFSKGGTIDISQEIMPGSFGHFENIGYRFVLTDEDGNASYLTDAGTKTDGNSYSVVNKNMDTVSKAGPMYHIFADSYNNPEWKNLSVEEFKKKFATRNHFNEAGGNIEGIIEKLKSKKGELEPYKLIMSTPIIGYTNPSPGNHRYWPMNSFQTTDLEAFKRLQVEIFNQGKGFVNDGAFTSQCISGYQMQDVLMNGKDSPFFNWFKLDSKEGNPALGVLPDRVVSINENNPDPYDYIKFKIVNDPAKRDSYDRTKATYIQFYDSRLTSKEQYSDPRNLIMSYDKVPNDNYLIKEHQDSVQPYFFQLSTNNQGLEKLNELRKYAGKSMNEIDKDPASKGFKNVLTFPHFSITNKSDIKRANFWDGNVDLIKLNLSMPDNTKASLVGSVQARNSMYSLATYWTKTTANALLEDVAKKSNDPSNGGLNKIAEKFDLNKKDFEAAVVNARSKDYRTKIIDMSLSEDDFLLEEMVNVPLDSLGFASDISALMSSPYITPRPYIMEDANKSKREFMGRVETDENGKVVKTGGYAAKVMQDVQGTDFEDKAREMLSINTQMSDLYNGDMLRFARFVLSNLSPGNAPDEKVSLKEKTAIKASRKMFDQQGELTEYGKFVARMVMPEIIKYGLAAGMFEGDIKSVSFDKETNSINYGDIQQKGLAALGIIGSDPDVRAKELIAKMSKAFNKSDNEKRLMIEPLLESLNKRLEGTNLETFRVAEAVLEQTGGGLNWRFDAAKDVADLDRRRKNGKFDQEGNFVGWKDNTFEKCWDDVIDIWGNFIDNVRKENSSAYTIAEVTDVWDFFNDNLYKQLPQAVKHGYWPPEGSEERKMVLKERGDLQAKDFGKYKEPNQAERMLYEITGATTGSNYSHLFGALPRMVGQNLENGNYVEERDKDGKVIDGGKRAPNVLEGAVRGLLSAGTLAYINGAHTFVDNHDKPRALFCLALDMQLYLSNFGDDNQKDRYKQTAKELTGLEPGTKDFKNLSAEGVAVGDAMKKAFEKTLGKDSEVFQKAIFPAVRNLALGKYHALGQENQDLRRAKAWGSKDFEISLGDVLKEAKFLAKNNETVLGVLNGQGEKIVADARESMLAPAKERFVKLWELNQLTPGIATLYAGDEYGMTGHEDPAKNNKVSNREPVPHYKIYQEGSNPDKELFETINAVSSISKLDGMSALSGGTPVAMPQPRKDGDTTVYALYHYDDKGSEVIGVVSTANTQTSDPFASLVKEKGLKNKVSSIVLPKDTLPGGLDTGAVFKRKEFNEKTKQYEDSKEEFCVAYDSDSGAYHLKRKGGGDIELDPMTNFFYRQKEDVFKKFYHNGYGHRAS